jgi:hypothetical protein
LEEYLDKASQQVSLPSSVLLGVSKVSIVESQFILPNHTQQLLSVPIELRFDELPCTSNSTNSSCVTQTTLYKLYVNSSSDPSSTKLARSRQLLTHAVEVEIVKWKCRHGDHSSHRVKCSSGDVVELVCSGSAGVLKHQCPIHNSSTVCASLFDNQDCKVLSNGEDSITCECSLTNLTSNKTQDLADSASSATINFGVVSRSLTHDFVSTWSSADNMSGNDVLENLTVLFSTVGVSVVGAVVMFLAWLLDKQDETAVSKRSAQIALNQLKGRREFNQSRTPSASLLAAASTFLTRSLSTLNFSSLTTQAPSTNLSIVRQHRKAMVYHHVIGLKEEKRIEESLPLVMRPVPLLSKCTNEVKMYHRWLGVYFHYSPTYSRPLRVLSLWISIVTMLFIQSVLYNLADPDDGSCERQKTMEDCLVLKSSLSKSSECVWEQKPNGQDQCSFRPIQDDFNRVLIVAMLSGILSSPFSIFFQSLILFVVSADTKSSPTEKKFAPRVSRRGWRQSHTSVSRVTEEENYLPFSLQQDFGILLKKMRLYRNELTLEEKIEFDCESLLPLPSSCFISLSSSSSSSSPSFRFLGRHR